MPSTIDDGYIIGFVLSSQAACHKDRSISKRAIEYIQDIITGLLVEQTELPHFHFNEALLKPFENLLSMETCDIDVQVS